MRSTNLAVAAALVSLAVGPPGLARAPAPFERPARGQLNNQSILGTWKLVEAHANGKHYAHETSQGQVWVITDSSVTINYRHDEVQVETFDYRIDPTTTPRQID